MKLSIDFFARPQYLVLSLVNFESVLRVKKMSANALQT